jgi:hypothetical protein
MIGSCKQVFELYLRRGFAFLTLFGLERINAGVLNRAEDVPASPTEVEARARATPAAKLVL